MLDEVDVVVAAFTGRELVVELNDVAVQSSHALPLSDGQPKLERATEVVEVVVAAATGRELVVELKDAVVQSSQALPFSDGQLKL